MAEQAKPAPRKKGGKKRERREVRTGVAHIQATFNNTIISVSDPEGNVLSWSSAGRIGFKGSRKGTPFAAQVAAQNAGTASAYNGTGNTIGGSRFDYVAYLRVSALVLKSVTVPDTRVNGVYPSDHDPVVAVFEVN